MRAEVCVFHPFYPQNEHCPSGRSGIMLLEGSWHNLKTAAPIMTNAKGEPAKDENNWVA